MWLQNLLAPLTGVDTPVLELIVLNLCGRETCDKEGAVLFLF